MRLSYDNLVNADNSLTVSSNEISTPASNLYDPYLTSFVLFTGNTSEWCMIDAGAGNTFDITAVGIAGHNFTSSAVIKIQGNATDSWGAPSFEETITYREGTIYHFTASKQTYRFIRLLVADTTNPDNLEIGYLSFDEYVQFPGLRPEVQITHTQVGTRSITQTGQISGTKDYSFRTLSLTLPNMTNTQRQTVANVAKSVYNSGVVIAVLWEGNFDMEPPIFGVIENETLGINKLKSSLNRFSSSFTLREAF